MHLGHKEHVRMLRSWTASIRVCMPADLAEPPHLGRAQTAIPWFHPGLLWGQGVLAHELLCFCACWRCLQGAQDKLSPNSSAEPILQFECLCGEACCSCVQGAACTRQEPSTARPAWSRFECPLISVVSRRMSRQFPGRARLR